MRSFRTVVFLVLASVAALAAENAQLSSVSLNSPTVVGGNPVSGVVTLNVPAPSDVQVSLAVDPAKLAKLPSSVTIPAGSKTAEFTISTPAGKSAAVGRDIVVTVYGTYGVTKAGSFTLLSPVPFDRIVDRVIERERNFVTAMKGM